MILRDKVALSHLWREATRTRLRRIAERAGKDEANVLLEAGVSWSAIAEFDGRKALTRATVGAINGALDEIEARLGIKT